MSRHIRITDSQVSTMLSLREDGYQNADIAKMLGINHLTVLNHIGKQPEEMTARYRTLRLKAQKEKEDLRVSMVREKRIREAQEVYAKQAALIRQAESLAQEMERSKLEIQQAQARYKEAKEARTHIKEDMKQTRELYRRAAQFLVKAGILKSSRPIRTSAIPEPSELTSAAATMN